MAVLIVVRMLFDPLMAAFQANIPFNATILGVFVVGILINFRQVTSLRPEIRWVKLFTIEREEGDPNAKKKFSNFFKKARKKSQTGPRPKLLNPLVKMMEGRNQKGFRMSATTMRSVLDGIHMRLDESRDISRYVTGLLVFLGLLGTFWGLLDTVIGVTDVISAFSPGAGTDNSLYFLELTKNLKEPLQGMGTAFSSSLFGLTGALIIGFLDLLSGHAQNRFFNELEEWLSDITHLPSELLDGNTDCDRSLPVYIEALLEQTADNLNKLQRQFAQSEEDRVEELNARIEISKTIADLRDQMRAQQKALIELSNSQKGLQPAISRLTDRVAGDDTNDATSRQHLRNLEISMTGLLKEISTGRTRFRDELREELRIHARALSGKADNRGE